MLTTEYFWHCESADAWSTQVKGSKETYSVVWGSAHKNWYPVKLDWSCTCKAYKYRPGYCKHINKVIASGAHCNWSEFIDRTEVGEDSTGNPCCPKCQGRVFSMGWGV